MSGRAQKQQRTRKRRQSRRSDQHNSLCEQKIEVEVKVATLEEVATVATVVKVIEEVATVVKVATVGEVAEVVKARCLLAETADGVLCQVFSFLNVREHWNLSRGSRQINQVSQLVQASPTQIDIPAEIYKYAKSQNLSEEVDNARIMQRLLNFRPQRLIIPANVETDPTLIFLPLFAT